MRRILASSALIPLAACIAVAGCSSGSPAPSSNANAAVAVSGGFGSTPKVTIPHQAPSAKLFYHVPIKGSGATLTSNNFALASVTLYTWSGKTSKLVAPTSDQLIPPSLALPGLVTALKGATIGSRVVAVLPPKYAYGSSGDPSVGISGKDTLVWVLDLLQQFAPTESASGTRVSSGGGVLPTVSSPAAGQAPKVVVPKHAPPAKLSVTTLIKGSGPKLAAGDTVVAQYVGVNWRTGKVFSESWPSSTQPQGALFGFQLGSGVITGWSDGLPGITVGSRVMLVIPPSLGYGPSGGQASAGIKKNDTLVFVIDVLARRTPSG